MLETFREFLTWVALYPNWMLGLLFVLCVGESIVVLGVLIPTSIVLGAAGALVALEALAFWPVMGAAVAGALVGDSINFWIGRHYGERVLQTPLAQRYQGAIAHSRGIFDRHGAKALVLGRFFGTIRPFVAGIAGAYGMRLWAFLLVEALAALLWATPLVVVGVAFGASLDLAAEVAGRLAVLIVALLVFVWLLVWLVRIGVDVLQARAESWVHGLLDWSHRHRRVGRLGAWLADPNQPETPGLAILALVLFAASALWLWAWWGLNAQHPWPFDALVYQALKGLHTPGALAAAVSLSLLGEWPVYLPVAAATLAVLVATRRTRAAWHWVAAVGFAAVIALGLTLLLALPDPLEYFSGNRSAPFSGRELVLATVVYGFIAALLATGRTPRLRTLFYALAVSLVGLTAAADMYVGAQWLSVGAFSVVIGAIWVGLLAVGYRRHGAKILHRSSFVYPVLGTFLIAAGVSLSTRFESRLAALTTPVTEHRLRAPHWWQSGFADLPAYRLDMAGVRKQPLNLQWLGSLDAIEQSLRGAGWESAVPLSWNTALRWLASAPIAELPVLPQIHDGHDQVLMLRKGIDDEQQWVLRLWPSTWQVDGAPLWVGSITGQYARELLGLRVPAMQRNFSEATQALAPAPAGFSAQRVRRPLAEPDPLWNGRLWLLQPQAPAP